MLNKWALKLQCQGHTSVAEALGTQSRTPTNVLMRIFTKGVTKVHKFLYSASHNENDNTIREKIITDRNIYSEELFGDR